MSNFDLKPVQIWTSADIHWIDQLDVNEAFYGGIFTNEKIIASPAPLEVPKTVPMPKTITPGPRKIILD